LAVAAGRLGPAIADGGVAAERLPRAGHGDGGAVHALALLDGHLLAQAAVGQPRHDAPLAGEGVVHLHAGAAGLDGPPALELAGERPAGAAAAASPLGGHLSAAVHLALGELRVAHLAGAALGLQLAAEHRAAARALGHRAGADRVAAGHLGAPAAREEALLLVDAGRPGARAIGGGRLGHALPAPLHPRERRAAALGVLDRDHLAGLAAGQPRADALGVLDRLAVGHLAVGPPLDARLAAHLAPAG